MVDVVNAAEADPIAAARSIADRVAELAAEGERTMQVSTELIQFFHDASLTRLLVPVELGGVGASLTEAFESIEAVSAADGSTGWTLMAGMTNLAVAAAFFGDDAVAEVFAAPTAFISGQIAPLGTCTAENGGMRVEGRFGFCSGADAANWIFGGFRELRNGEQVRHDTDLPVVMAALVPKEKVEFLGNWDTIGLRATGSYDYQIPEQWLPDAFTFSFFDAKPKRGGRLYDIGANGLTCVAHGAFACGAAKHILAELATVAHSKRRPGRRMLIDDDIFQFEFADATGKLNAARAGLLSTLGEMQRSAEAGAFELKQRALTRVATTHACKVASEIAQTAYRFAGSTGLRNGTTLQRCFRDIAAGEQHIFTDQGSYVDSAKVLLGRAGPNVFV